MGDEWFKWYNGYTMWVFDNGSTTCPGLPIPLLPKGDWAQQTQNTPVTCIGCTRPSSSLHHLNCRYTRASGSGKCTVSGLACGKPLAGTCFILILLALRVWVLSFISLVQSLSRVRLFVTPWTAACQLPCLSPTPGVCSNSCSSSRWCHPTISSSVIHFSFCLQPFPASGSFQMSQFFASGGQSIGASASASVLPINIEDWSPLGWTGWISLLSKGLSRVLQHHSSKASILWRSALFMVQLSHPYMTTGKNHSFDYMDLCQQSNISAF